MAIPSAGKNTEHPELSLMGDGNENGRTTLENSLAFSYKVKHTLQCDIMIPLIVAILRIHENICLDNDLQEGAYSQLSQTGNNPNALQLVNR